MITLTEPCTMPEEQLTSTQQTALTSLVLGKTVSEAAGEAGVHRNTVHRWIKNDEPFRAAKHRVQRDARATVEAKLHDTAMAAVDCIEKCLREGDAYVAEQLLKGLGCFDGKLKNLGKDEAVELAVRALLEYAGTDPSAQEQAIGFLRQATPRSLAALEAVAPR